MKAIGYIILSYFQQHFFGILGMIVSLIMFTGGHFSIFADNSNSDENYRIIALLFFMFAAGSLVFSMSTHLKRMIKSNAGVLFPNYRIKQLTAAGLLISLYSIWPVILMGLAGLSILKVSALLLFTTVVILWLVFLFGEDILVLTVILWSIRFVYEILGLPSDYKIFGIITEKLSLGSELFIAIILISVSLISFWWFCIYFLKLTLHNLKNTENDKTDPWAKDFDTADKMTLKLVNKKIKNLITEKVTETTSLFRYAKAFQYCLFSPGYTSATRSLLFIVGLFIYGSTLFILQERSNDINRINEMMLPLCFLIYQIGISMITTDFLQHRDRLATIWLQSPVAGKKQFAKATILTYYMIIGKQYLIIFIAFILAAAIIPAFSFTNLLQLGIMCIFISMILVSWSLLFSKYESSRECKTWTILNIVVAMIMFPIMVMIRDVLYDLYSFSLMMSVAGLICILFFFLAYIKWMGTELDFKGPELPA